MVLRYICVLVCCCKRLDACMYTACQGIYIKINTLLETFFDHLFYNLFSLYFLSRSAYIMADFSVAVKS